MAQDGWRAGVDIGGTFTDLLLVDQTTGRFRVGKVLTTAREPAAGVREALTGELESGDLSADALGTLVHGTTLVTNAVIERKGAITALLITEGFRDTLLIGREHRYDMYDVRLEKPEPLVPRRLTFAIPERVLADGTVYRPLDEAAVAALADVLRAARVRAVGVCLLHAYRHPQHELRVREILQQRDPELRIALSHEVVGDLREYERASTTVANAYVMDVVDRYLGRLQSDLAEIGHRGEFLVMLSSGATATPDTARRFPVRLMESGPAAGALAAAHMGKQMGRDNLLSFDMGGTTAKACLIERGRPSIGNQFEVARLQRFKTGSGLPIKISSVDLIEIGAGGGSIARVDRFGLLKVGPDSSGSEPGPVCYGRGGKDPTVTDADLILGYLDPHYFLGGRMALDTAAAERAIQQRLADPLGLDVARAAWTVHQVVNENMANATRVHTVERGRDARAFPLFAFGGAGPVHAYRVAEKLGVNEVIAPFAAGVGSTIGLLAAPLAFDFVRTAAARVRSLDWTLVAGLLQDMEQEGRSLLRHAGVADPEINVERAADMRLIGQAHEITVELPGAAPVSGHEARLEHAFEVTYTGLFGRTPPNVPMEVVSWRVRLSGPRPDLELGMSFTAGDTSRSLKGERYAYFPELGGYHSTPVYDRYKLAPGSQVRGPAIVEERESTLVIGPRGFARVDGVLNLIVELS